MKLRKYQEQAVESVIEYWQGQGGNPLVVLPTGTGKSLVLAALMTTLYRDYGARCALVTHVSELVSQDEKALAKYWPDAPRGVYHAGLKRREGDAPLLFSGIQSVVRNLDAIGKREVLLIDEAHLINHRDVGMYRKLITHMQGLVPGMRVCGLTATPYRMSTGRLDEDYGPHEALFSDICYEMSILDAIKQGWINPIIPYVSPNRIDTSEVATKGKNGDFKDAELQAAVDRDDITERVVSEALAAMGRYGRRMGITFAAGVQHAQHLCDRYRVHGCAAELITGETGEAERQRIFAEARAGKLGMLVGVGTLTTGVDVPNIDIIICARPTKSKGLWTQMLGRGTRLSPETEKESCLLLDFTDNSLDIGPLDTLDGRKSQGSVGEAPMRACPSCCYVHHISLGNCPECGHEYPVHELKINSAPSTAAVLSTQQESYWMDVNGMRVRRHVKDGKADSLRIDYQCGFRYISRWIALENEKARGLAKQWWRANTTNVGDPPETVTEALERSSEIRRPFRILVSDRGKYPDIEKWDYSVEMDYPVEEPMTISSAYNRRFSRAS